MRYIFKYIYTRIKNALIYLIILWLAIVVLFQKKKIEEFYNFFINNKQKFNLESLSLNKIKDDPEKFNTKYGF
jgi:hypothetical protein